MNEEITSKEPEIIDVDTLPVIDDEDFQNDIKNPEKIEIDEEKITYTQAKLENDSPDTKQSEVTECPKLEDQAKAYEKSYNQYNPNNGDNPYTQGLNRDTSYNAFNTARKEQSQKKKKKAAGVIAQVILILLGVFVGLPVGAFLLFFLMMGVGMAVLGCGMGVVMGIVGLGVAAFMTTSGTAALGTLILFGSLFALGAGGFGLCLFTMVVLGIKNLCVKAYNKYQARKLGEEA